MRPGTAWCRTPADVIIEAWASTRLAYCGSGGGTRRAFAQVGKVTVTRSVQIRLGGNSVVTRPPS
jgi:hypothetical protein